MTELSPFERKIVDAVKTHGFFIMGVGAGEGAPSFSYSIGFLETLGQPEVILLGLDHELRHALIWRVFEAAKTGRVVEDGSVWTELLDGYACEMRAVHPDRLGEDWLNSALWYWSRHLGRAAPFRACQIFWPGVRDHRLPWAPGADPSVVSAQPRLDRPAG